MKYSFQILKDNLKSHYDVFMASVSYEDRCLSVSENILSYISFEKKIVSWSSPHKNLMEFNLSKFDKLGFEKMEVNNTNQILTVNNIYSQLNDILGHKPDASFLIDISTFTRQTLLILLRILRNALTVENHIDFVYTSAKEYAVGLPESEKWLSKGIVEVNSVFGYLGVIRPTRPYHLIILMGYEVERAGSLINAYEPTKISIGYGKRNGSISQEHYQLNQQKFEELHSEFPNAEAFEFSCVSLEESKNDILNQVNKHKGYNSVISPMNNKISTVACALAAFDDESIQLAIAIPAIYNSENYSIPDDECYILNIPNFIK